MSLTDEFEQLLQQFQDEIFQHEQFVNYAYPSDKILNKKVQSLKEYFKVIKRIHDENTSHFMSLFIHDAQAQVADEMEYLRQYNEENAATTKRLRSDIERLVKQNTFLKDEISQLKDKLAASQHHVRRLEEQVSNVQIEIDKTHHSAARRQIAHNIEYELKLELLGILNHDVDNWYDYEIDRQDIQDLRRQVKSLSTQMDLTTKLPLIDVLSDDDWYKFSDAMRYMKVFSQDQAHPISLNGDLITLDTAKKLVDEPFDITNMGKRKCRFAWNDNLRNEVKRYIDVLASNYRKPTEQLLYNLN